MKCEVEYTNEFEQWWETLDSETQDSIGLVVKLLEENGWGGDKRPETLTWRQIDQIVVKKDRSAIVNKTYLIQNAPSIISKTPRKSNNSF